MGRYAGVDWAGDKHDVLVGDEAGGELLAATFAHDEKGLRALGRALLGLTVELVAIERPDGLLVERLWDAGLQHPEQVAASRARFRAAGGTSDRLDAFVLCELARTEHHRVRVLTRAVLAGPGRPVPRARPPDLARVPGALPQPSRRARLGPAAPSGVLCPPALLGWPQARRAALTAQTCAGQRR